MVGSSLAGSSGGWLGGSMGYAWAICFLLIPPAGSAVAKSMHEQVEADWLRQAEAVGHPSAGRGTVPTWADAAGAVDGVKNGKYAFHTAREPNPWWRVDLGEPTPIGRIVVYNRLDYAPGLHNADHLVILTSDDARQWTRRHENAGKHFGGTSGAKPLEVLFKRDEVVARFLRLQIPSDKPIYFHLDEVEIYGPSDVKKNIALSRPADQSSISQWSTAKIHTPAGSPSAYPTAEVAERGRRLAADLRAAGVDTRPFERDLEEVDRQWQRLGDDASEETRRELYFAARRTVRRLAFANPLLKFDKLLLVKRFTQETYPDVCLNHMPWVSRPGGDICVVSLAGPDGEPEVRNLLDGALGPGHVHGMDLWWDANRVVFGYAKAKTDQPPPGWTDRRTNYDLRRTEEPTHLFEIRIDGTDLRQLTDGPWSDLDPTYAPDGQIAFVSERCACSLQCYTRWEYQERLWAQIQSIWTVRPDGTGADALFKQHLSDPWALEDVHSIPGTSNRKLTAIAAGHHTLAAGPVVVVTPGHGMNDSRAIRIVTPGVRPSEGGMSGTPVDEGGPM